MHTTVLTASQLAVLDGLTAIAPVREFYLAGGTALALRHGHRRSVDFDFFRQPSFDTDALAVALHSVPKPQGVSSVDSSSTGRAIHRESRAPSHGSGRRSGDDPQEIPRRARGAGPQRPPVFRARATAVSLDVSVKRGNNPVTGLTAADFAVTDNGVPQIVEQAFTDVVPIDVTLIIDASNSAATIFDDIRRDTRRILGLLRPDDRARLLVIETNPYELLPLQAVAGEPVVLPEQRPSHGRASLHDARLVGLVTPPDPDRRRLVVAITQGVDTKSITSVPSLERVARRTDAVLHIVSVRPPPPDRGGGVFPDGTRVIVEEGAPSSPFELTLGFGSMVRYRGSTTAERELFETLPGLTGGAFHGPGRWGRNPNVVAAIRDLIAEFRQSYVIQSTPRDVASGGWHDVVVRVKGVDPAGVRTRAGYVDTDQ